MVQNQLMLQMQWLMQLLTLQRKRNPVHVRLVKFLIFQTNMVADFHQSMIRRSGEKVEEDKGLLTKIRGQ